MHTIIITGTTASPIRVWTSEEVACSTILTPEEKGVYSTFYSHAKAISLILAVKCPDIAFVPLILAKDLSEQGARLVTPKDEPELKNNLILMSLNDYNEERSLGELAHEMRHIWQDKYKPKLNRSPAKGFQESLLHPAEVDADGFGIWYLSNLTNISLERAAQIICPKESQIHQGALIRRIKAAERLIM